jgi:hypothetical protein
MSPYVALQNRQRRCTRVKLGADWIGSARHGTARFGSGERPRTASEPIDTRDPVLIHDTLGHDGEFTFMLIII